MRRTWRAAIGVCIVALFALAAGLVPAPPAASRPSTTRVTTTTAAAATRTTTTQAATVRVTTTRAAATLPATLPTARQENLPPIPPPPIPLDSVATEAESADITLRQVAADADTDRVAGYVASELEPLTTQIDAQLAETTSLLENAPLLQTLATLELDWSGIDDQLTGWHTSLHRRTDRLVAQKAQLKVLGERWEQTRDAAVAYFRRATTDDVRRLMADKIDACNEVIVRVNSTRDLNLTGRIIAVYTLSQQADGQDARVRGVLESVREARAAAFDRLFVRGDVPVWRLLTEFDKLSAGGGGYGSVFEQARVSFARQAAAIAPYVRLRREAVGLHLFVIAALAGGMVWLRRRVRVWAATDPGAASGLATVPFATPVSTAIVLSLVVAVWLYPRPPQLFRAGAGIAVLVPAVLVLRRLLQRRLFPILAALVVSYLLDQVRGVAASVPVLSRSVFLTQMFYGALLVAWYVQKRDQTPAKAAAVADVDRVGRLVGIGVRLYGAVLFAAFVGDALGYVVLSELVGGAALDGAYLAMVLYAGTRIAAGLVVLATRAQPLSLLRSVRDYRLLLVRRLTVAFEWLAVAAWVVGMLEMLSLAASALGLADRVANVSIGLGAIRFTPVHVVVFGLTLYAAVLVSRFVRFFLTEDVYVRFPMAGGLSYAVNQIVHYAVLLVGFYLAVAASGVQMTQFALLAGAFGVGLGFGLQTVVNNFISGLILLFERPVKVGDVVQIGDTTGVVDHIGIRASVIRTIDSSEVIVPNGNLLSNQLTNWTLSNRQRGITIALSLAASADPKMVMTLLTSTAAAHPKVLARPTPQAFLTKIASDSFGYELHAWTTAAEQWNEIRSDLQIALHGALATANVAIK